MSPEQAAAAWRREIRRVAPDAPAALQQWVAEQLARGDVSSGALASLADHLVAIASVVSEEARATSVATAQVIPLRRVRPHPDDFPPAAA